MLIALRLAAATLMGLIGTAFITDGASAPAPGDLIVVPRTGPESSQWANTDMIVFKHGDISWLPILAAKAGWPADTWPRLGQIILRESGGCPNRRGGDVVDKDCKIIRVSEWNHRSDTGLLQINGVHWKPDHPQYVGKVCKIMGVCTQERLFDALTNLRAGKLLYDLAGWDPWQIRSDK